MMCPYDRVMLADALMARPYRPSDTTFTLSHFYTFLLSKLLPYPNYYSFTLLPYHHAPHSRHSCFRRPGSTPYQRSYRCSQGIEQQI